MVWVPGGLGFDSGIGNNSGFIHEKNQESKKTPGPKPPIYPFAADFTFV